MPLALTITNRQKVLITLTPNDGGNPPRPVPVDGAPAWSIIDGDSTIEPSEDGLSCEFISSDANGVTHAQVAADADLGSGIVTITDTVELTVIDAQAQSLGLVSGTPENK